MKKIFIITISLVLLLGISLFALTGCGEEPVQPAKNTNVQATPEVKEVTNVAVDNSTNTEETPAATSEKYEYNYVDGVLTQVVDEEGNPKQTDFTIGGIILVGNRHSYAELDTNDAETVIEKLVQQGYKTEGINSSFYLNEYIEFYIDTQYTGEVNDVKILATPHRTVEELEEMSYSQLEELALENGGFVIDYTTPDVDNYKYVGNGYVNMDYPEGKYDILFTYKGKLAYFINITETKEPVE